MADAKQYKKLQKVIEYDHEAAEELAEAVNEINLLNNRIKELQLLVKENRELQPFLWRSVEGFKALHKLDDDHLSNIMKHIVNQGVTIHKEIRAEANKRGLPVPLPPAGGRAVPMPDAFRLKTLAGGYDHLRPAEELCNPLMDSELGW